MKLPKLDDLIREQTDVYFHAEDGDLFVAGPPGSGKTSLAVLRGTYLANMGLRVLLITRNRMLTALANDLAGGKLQTSTMHTAVTSHYYRTFKEYIPKLGGPYSFDWSLALNNYAARGPTTCFDHIVVDEGQNLPQDFFHWAKLYGAKTLSVFADEDQSTYDERTSLRQIQAAGLPNPIRLTRNHRNTPEIAAVAEHFHRGEHLAPGITTRAASGERPELLRILAWQELATRVATRLSNRGESIGLIMQNVPDARLVHRLVLDSLEASARVNIYTSDAPDGHEFGIRMLDPGVTVLTGESSIGLEFDAVFLQDIMRSLPCTSELQYRRMYMLCARAKNSLILVDGPNQLLAAQISDLPPPNLLTR